MTKHMKFKDRLASVAGSRDECWIWPLALNRGGYGKVKIGGKGKLAHRMAYELLVEYIPDGMVIDHLCRNKPCCNPNHLRVVTNRENVLCGVGITAINATKTHCVHGHELSGDNIYKRRGYRECKACRTRHTQNYRNKKRKAELREASA